MKVLNCPEQYHHIAVDHIRAILTNIHILNMIDCSFIPVYTKQMAMIYLFSGHDLLIIRPMISLTC